MVRNAVKTSNWRAGLAVLIAATSLTFPVTASAQADNTMAAHYSNVARPQTNVPAVLSADERNY